MAWTNDQLATELRRYEQQCERSGLQQITVDSYVRYASMFLRWRMGDYRPAGAVGQHQPRRGPATSADLRADHRAYEADLRGAGLQPQAVHTYVVHSGQFVRWLDGDFTPGSRVGGSVQRPAPLRNPLPVSPAPASAIAEPNWTWEGSVQTAMRTWLEASGWTIEGAADTSSGEHGPDIIASLGNRRLAVEVKGYPQPTYARGDRAGEPKKWHPASQARTYFGTAIHVALIMRDGMSGVEVALAFPDVPGYRGLLDQVHASLAELRVRVFLVGQSGSVRELVPAKA